MRKTPLNALVAAVLLAALSASAEQYVYPAKGQSKDQQKKDEAACGQWATEQAGDPAKTAAPPPPAEQKGGRLRGAAAGAVIAGATDGDKSEGAVAGAVVGGAAQRRRNAANQQQAQAAASQQQAAGQESFEKARAACLEGKGYTVK